MDLPETEKDKLSRAAGQEFYDKAKDNTKGFIATVNKAAKKHKVQVSYLWWLLMGAPGGWTVAAGEHDEWLAICIRMFVKSKWRVPPYGDFTLPDEAEEYRVNKAIKDIATWAGTTYKALLKKASIETVQKYGDKLYDYAQSIGAEGTKLEGRVTILRNLRRRLKERPFWFTDHLTMRQIHDLTWGKKIK
jgi:hypothetical protein